MPDYVPGKKLSINQWAEDDRPREKLIQKGRAALSDAELIAILIGSGNRDESAVDLSKRILNQSNQDLNQLASLSIKDLCKVKGIGEAKAIGIMAALELGRRRNFSTTKEIEILNSADLIYEFIKPVILDLPHEQFWVILLKNNLKLIKKFKVSDGGISGVLVDVRLIFKEALENLATHMVLIHNHPSGNLNPSQADEKLTKQIQEAGILLNIKVIDHLICTNEGYYSFENNQKL